MYESNPQLSFGLPPFGRVPGFAIRNSKSLISDLRPLTSDSMLHAFPNPQSEIPDPKSEMSLSGLTVTLAPIQYRC